MGNTWGPDGPPEEAYSRVTNPERFEPIIVIADELIKRLQADFDVSRIEGPEVDAEFTRMNLTLPSVRLIPRDEKASEVIVAFHSFPGVWVRVGHWVERGFPDCGCDACDETVDELQGELEALTGDVIAGRFRESIDPADGGDFWLASANWGPDQRAGGQLRIDADRARELIARADGKTSFEYSPWPKRKA